MHSLSCCYSAWMDVSVPATIQLISFDWNQLIDRKTLTTFFAVYKNQECHFAIALSPTRRSLSSFNSIEPYTYNAYSVWRMTELLCAKRQIKKTVVNVNVIGCYVRKVSASRSEHIHVILLEIFLVCFAGCHNIDLSDNSTQIVRTNHSRVRKWTYP